MVRRRKASKGNRVGVKTSKEAGVYDPRDVDYRRSGFSRRVYASEKEAR